MAKAIKDRVSLIKRKREQRQLVREEQEKRKQEEKGTTEDEMVGWHHRLDGHEFEQTPGDGEGHGRLACCSP